MVVGQVMLKTPTILSSVKANGSINKKAGILGIDGMNFRATAETNKRHNKIIPNTPPFAQYGQFFQFMIGNVKLKNQTSRLHSACCPIFHFDIFILI